MKIAGLEISRDAPTRIVAEISNNHNGSRAKALRLIRECAEAGADFVKFQCYTPQELVELRGDGLAPDPWGSQGWSLRQLYTQAQTPHEWFPELVDECRALGIGWFSSVFGTESLGLLLDLGCPALKIAALDNLTPFAELVAEVAPIHEIPLIASARTNPLPWADLTLWCPPGYPQRPERLDTMSFRHYMSTFDGFSYHGVDWSRPGWAAVHGAQIVECHVELDNVPSELEHDVSITVDALRKLCRAVARED